MGASEFATSLIFPEIEMVRNEGPGWMIFGPRDFSCTEIMRFQSKFYAVEMARRPP